MYPLHANNYLITLVCFSIHFVVAYSTEDGWPLSASKLVRTSWTGTWHGAIEAYPEGQLGHGWHKTLIIGPYPTSDSACTTWNSTFTQHGVVQLRKDYRFCRGRDAEDLYVDIGSGATLRVQWINDVLISSFKHNGVFGVSSLRLRNDILKEEVINADDQPGVEDMVVSMRTRSIHFIEMRRVTDEE